MLFYKNGLFHAGSISFPFPDGFYLNTEPDCQLPAGIEAIAADESYHVLFEFEEICEDCVTELSYWLEPDTGYHAIEPIEAVFINGFPVYQCTYGGRITSSYEARFDLGSGKQFSLAVSCDAEDDIVSLKNTETVQRILHSIKKSDPVLTFYP